MHFPCLILCFQTFESVIPSERTQISLKISDASFRAFAPSHLGAAVTYIGNLDFSTDIFGSVLKSSIRLSIPALAFLAIDDISECGGSEASVSHHGIAFWKVRSVMAAGLHLKPNFQRAGFALLAEIADLDMNIKHIHLEKSSVPFVWCFHIQR
jgi:autophagy-related protein 2